VSAQAALDAWATVDRILAQPVPETAPEQLALCADPTAPLALFDVDAPDWHHERTAE
jgi:hypothetical protein